ncbi:MAG: glycosyltransferase family 39 protein, partial [Gemmatimonadota bacterium]
PGTGRVVLATVLGGALVYWIWLGTVPRSITTDPAISILAARGILEHGYPVLPSGYLYPRAVLPHALVAGSIGLFGLNDFAITLPAALMSMGSLLLTYLLARDALGARWLGIAATLVLVAIQQQAFYATSPRMYMGLQFFTILAVYSGWKGWLEDRRGFRWLALFAVVGAMLSHQQGGIVALMIPLAILAARALTDGFRGGVRELPRLAGFAVLLLLWYRFVLRHWFPGTMPQIALRGGTGARTAGLSLDVRQWLSHVNWLEHTVPLGLLLLPAVLLLLYGALSRRSKETSPGVAYLAAVFGVWALGVLGYVRISGERFWVGIVPVYVLLLLAGTQLLTRRPFSPALSWAPRGVSTRVAAAVVAAWSVVVISGASIYYGSTGYWDVIKTGYGVPCSRVADDCWFGKERAFRELREVLGPEDRVVATQPMVASYYLPRIHGWLVQQSVGDLHQAFDSPTDEYLGIPLIDTQDELVALADSPQRAWVIMDTGADRWLSEEMTLLLERSFHLYHRSGHLTVYVSSAEGLPQPGEASGADAPGNAP